MCFSNRFAKMILRASRMHTRCQGVRASGVVSRASERKSEKSLSQNGDTHCVTLVPQKKGPFETPFFYFNSLVQEFLCTCVFIIFHIPLVEKCVPVLLFSHLAITVINGPPLSEFNPGSAFHEWKKIKVIEN